MEKLIFNSQCIQNLAVYITKKEYKAVSKIAERLKLQVLCGGTGLYLSAVIQNYKLNRKDIHSREELEKLSFDELKSLFLSLNKSPHNTTDVNDRNRTIDTTWSHNKIDQLSRLWESESCPEGSASEVLARDSETSCRQ